MPSILFLTSQPHHGNDNHARLPNAFRAHGWSVSVAEHTDVQYNGNTVCTRAAPLSNFDWIWPIGFGPQTTYLDRLALLRTVNANRFVNPVVAVDHLHGKVPWLDLCALTCISEDPDVLTQWSIEHGGEWVLKPMAGSFGTGVHRIASATQINSIVRAAAPRLWLLQRYLPDIAKGEVRTLVFGDEILGGYLRKPQPGEFRANLAAQGLAYKLAAVESSALYDIPIVQKARQRLKQHGLRFAAIDFCGDYLMEVNVANPGGLATLESLYGSDPSMFLPGFLMQD